MRLALLAFITSALLLTGCITQADQQGEANQMVQQLHSAIQHHQWADAAKLYDPEYFKQHSQQQWQLQFENTFKKLGDITQFAITSQQKDPRFGGDFYIYIISASHSGGSVSHETITILKPLDDKPMMITGYQFKAKGI